MDTRVEEKKKPSRRSNSNSNKSKSADSFGRDKKKIDSKKDGSKDDKPWRRYRTNKKKPKI